MIRDYGGFDVPSSDPSPNEDLANIIRLRHVKPIIKNLSNGASGIVRGVKNGFLRRVDPTEASHPVREPHHRAWQVFRYRDWHGFFRPGGQPHKAQLQG